MNVTYRDISSSDVARMLGLNVTTIAGWCRHGLINCTNISDGTKRARYLISEDEVEYLRRLAKKHGKRNILKYYHKDWNAKPQPVQQLTPEPTTQMATDDDLPTRSSRQPFDEDKILNSILYLREVRERIEDCKAELAQLENEYRELKQELIDQI